MVPIYKTPEQLAEICARFGAIAAELRDKGISVKIDDRDNVRPGFKFAEYELKGVPVRLAMGGRDLENGTIELVRRDTLEKQTVSQEGLVERIEGDVYKRQEEYGYKELEDTLIKTYVSVGVKLNHKKAVSLITMLRNKRMIVQENGRKYTFMPDFHY